MKNSWVIHDNSCCKKIIYVYSCLFMLIRVEKKIINDYSCLFMYIRVEKKTSKLMFNL